MTEKLLSQIRSLEHQVEVLTEENAQLAERAEDSLLLGLISENIQHQYDKIEIFNNGLEQISILKGIPFCSCGRIVGPQVQMISSYASFSDSTEIGYPITLDNEMVAELEYGPVLVDDFRTLKVTFSGSEFQPTNGVIIPFIAQHIPDGVFIFFDDAGDSERLASMLMLLNHAVDIIVAKYDNVFLLEALKNANKELEQRVEDRTSELTKANRALLKSELKYRQLVENANDAIFVAQDGKLVFFNDKTLHDLKYEREELANVPFIELVHPDYRELVTEYYSKRLKRSSDIPTNYVITALTKDKEELIVEISSVAVDWNDKPATLNFARDISEQRSLEEKYHHAQKMEAIGQLASGVAHDFNNMLGGIMGAAEMLGVHLPGDDKLQKLLEIIVEAANRSSALTAKLLSFSRSNQQVSANVDVHDVVLEAVVLLENSIDPRVKIQVDLAGAKSNVIGDPSQLQSVIINLGINGSHAMPNGGLLSISSKTVELDSHYCQNSSFDIAPGEFLELRVRDNGTGIEPQLIEKIFEPFFTTKEQGRGTGLGLASAYGTVQQHGGSITVHTEVGKGTTFKIFLPINDVASSTTKDGPNVLKGNEKILVIDDEAVMRLTARAILEELGYDVTTAEDGKEGVQLFLDQNCEFDLVLLDMVMPIMNGRDCFKEMKKYKADVRVILSSGYSEDADFKEMQEYGLAGFVKKPYRRSTLSEAIYRALKQ